MGATTSRIARILSNSSSSSTTTTSSGDNNDDKRKREVEEEEEEEDDGDEAKMIEYEEGVERERKRKKKSDQQEHQHEKKEKKKKEKFVHGYNYSSPRSYPFKENFTLRDAVKGGGMYDIICMCDSKSIFHKMKGTVHLFPEQRHPEHDETLFEICGLVQVDEECRRSSLCYHRDYRFRTCGFDGLWMKATYVDEEDNRKFPLKFGYANVTLRCLNTRIALPLIRYQKKLVDGGDDVNVGTVFEFASIQEAEETLEQHTRWLQETRWSWLDNHTNLIPEVTNVIRQFGIPPPDPVLFLEPDDLILDQNWDPVSQDRVRVWCVLRKRVIT